MSVVALLLAALVAGPALRAPVVCYQHPVAAPIAAPFDRPACRWCPGNRGIDYGTRPGDPVRAAAPGRVRFAGSVARARWVTVVHADGLRTSYGPLAAVLVAVGQPVGPSTVLGRAAGRLHVGLRRGDEYLDPAVWFARQWLMARLVPLTGPLPARPIGSCTRAAANGATRLGRLGGSSASISRRPPPLVTVRHQTPALLRSLSRARGRRAQPQGRRQRTPWLSSRCASCSTPECTSGIRPAAGTRR